jgi:hypothetical protein
VQVVISGRSRPFRGRDDGPDPRCVERARQGGLLDPGGPRPVQLTELEPPDLAQHRLHDVRPPELDCEPGGREQAPAAGARRAELRGASQRGDRHRDRAPLPRACARCFELDRDLLVFAGEQRRAMPCAPVGLVIEHARQRLVGAAALSQARALRDGRADQWMPEADGVRNEVDDAGVDGVARIIDIDRAAGDGARGVQDLAQALLVAERGDEQDQTGRPRQLGDANGEGPLESLGQW